MSIVQPSSSGSAASSSNTEFPVIVPKDVKKVFNVLRFAGSADVPNMLKMRRLLMKREDNSRQQNNQAVQTADGQMPKTGAGSEFGREERDERFRRLRGGRTLRKYSPDDQPWIASFVPPASTSKDVKPAAAMPTKPRRFRGLREAGATENASWFIFAQRPDKSFIALPISEWYGFTAMTQYDHLNSDEVEEEFQKRKKTLNFFTLMLQKRLKNQDLEPGELEAQVKEEKTSKGGRRGGMHLTDLDAEWVDEEEEEMDDEEGEEGKKSKGAEDNAKIADVDADVNPATDKKKVSKKKVADILRKNKRLRSKSGEDAESDLSDSDEGDFDGREMDYMTSSGAESELDDAALPDDVKEEVEEAETAERGVEDEEGLRKLNDSAEEDEDEDEETKDSKEDEMDADEKESRSRQESSDSDGGNESGKDEDSDSDIERLELSTSGRQTSGNSKRRLPAEVITASGKRIRLELPPSNDAGSSSAISSGSSSTMISARSSGSNDIDSQLEQAIRHYLSRTPMSAVQLVEKFLQKARAASASGSNVAPPSSEDLAKRIAAIILRLKPEQIRSNNTVYFSLSPDKVDAR